MTRTPALILVFGFPAAVCAAWTVLAGKDVNWDLLNYHYYAPFALLAGRLDQDFFAASAQSYLNPVGYVPFYLMVSSGGHSVLVSMTLAAAHSVSIALLYLLAWRLFSHLPARQRVPLSALAAALGAANGVYWMTVGSSFLDPLLVPLMLGGLLLLVDAEEHKGPRAALAGVLFGAACALKYSNAIFALAALPLAAAMPGRGGAPRYKTLMAYVAGGTVALALLAGPWFLALQREFGNPVFPLMNGWFRSPDALPVNFVGARFRVQGLEDVVRFPFRMVGLDRSLYSENFAPDVRFAALTAAALALLASTVARGAVAERRLKAADWRVLTFFAAALALWLATSVNARYGLLVLLLAGVCLARIAERLLPLSVARVGLVVVLAVQVGITLVASPSRWFIAEPWSRRWLPWDVPERAQRTPALYLTVEMLPMAAIAPLLHRDSALVNFRGQHSLPPDSPRLAALLARYRGKVRTLGRDLELVEGRPRAHVLRAYDRTLGRIGYRVDPSDCFTIAWRPDMNDPLTRLANRLSRVPPAHEPLSVVSCRLRESEPDLLEARRERRLSALFDRIEKACAGLFLGQTAVTEPLLNGWSRYYTGLDARLEAFGDHVILNLRRAGRHVDLGSLSGWEREDTPRPVACTPQS